MLIYGGYQDLRGSSNELWGFHFDTESWHLLSSSSSGITCSRSTGGGGSHGDIPPARHKHSAILHDDAMWVYGGMTDLQERADFWRWDTVAKTWTSIRAKPGPGALHSHAACKLPSSMLLFGGERDGHPTNELWRFHFGTESWERLQIQGPRPQPRAESVALAVSELLLQDSPVFQQPSDATALATSFSSASQGRSHHRSRGGGSVDRCTALNPRHSSYHPNNRVSPCERKYVFRATPGNYVDGSSVNQQLEQLEASGSVNGRRDPGTASTPSGQTQAANSFLREISKLSQINLSRLSHHKCSYSVLSSSSHDDSTESLLHQQQCSSPGREDEEERVPHHDCDSTPSKNTMVKSQSANVISRRKHQEPPTPTTSAENEQDSGPMVKHHSGCTKAFQNGGKRKVSVAPTSGRCGTLPRDPISVPNFGTISSTLPTPVLTPVEVTCLVFVDTDTDDNDGDEPVNTLSSQQQKDDDKLIQVQPSPSSTNVTDFSVLHQEFQPTFRSENGKKRSESYNSHLLSAGTLDCPSTSSQNTEKVTAIPKSASVRFRTRHSVAENEEVSDETVSTSDYASIEAVNRISSASNYSMCTRPSPVDSHYHLPYYQQSEEFSLGRLSIGSKSNGKAKTPSKDGPFGFCNPNYLGPDIQTILASAGQRKSWHISAPATGDNEPLSSQVAQTKQHFQTYARLLNSPPDSVLEDATGRSISRQFYQEELMELQSLDSWSQPPSLATTPGVVPATIPNKRIGGPPQFLALGSPYNTLGVEKRKKSRASSASRAEKQAFELEDEEDLGCFSAETPSVPLYMFILGGKEQGQVTVFKRPVSVWKLQLAPNIF